MVRTLEEDESALIRRFISHVAINPSTGCWEWTGKSIRKGYGQMRVDTIKKESAHRLSYKIFKGEISDGLQVCHTCDNPKCVNPSHLFLGTNMDNVLDSIKKGRRNNWCANHAFILTESTVYACRLRHLNGESACKTAKDLGIPARTIQDAINGTSWKNVPMPKTLTTR